MDQLVMDHIKEREMLIKKRICLPSERKLRAGCVEFSHAQYLNININIKRLVLRSST